MEIKTCEQYVLAELERKNAVIEEKNAEIEKLKCRMENIIQELNKLKSAADVLSCNASFTRSETNDAYYLRVESYWGYNTPVSDYQKEQTDKFIKVVNGLDLVDKFMECKLDNEGEVEIDYDEV